MLKVGLQRVSIKIYMHKKGNQGKHFDGYQSFDKRNSLLALSSKLYLKSGEAEDNIQMFLKMLTW